MNEIRYFSMFTGVGGFELGLEKSNLRSNESQVSSQSEELHNSENEHLNWKCVGMSEWDKYSSQVLRYRFPNIKNWGDCTKIRPEDLPDFDMLCGGFPCQAFSIAGKRRGFEDTRGTMFFEVARILKVKRPKIVLLENVKGLLNHNKGETFRVILQTLDELGYEVQWMVLNSKFHGVPQNRERVFIIGNIRGTSRSEILPFRCDVPETIIKNKGQGILLSATTGARRVEQSNCLDTMYHKGLGSKQERPAVAELKYVGAIMSDKNKKWLEDGKEFSRNFPQGQRVYSTEGCSSTLAGNAGGLGGKTGLYEIKQLNDPKHSQQRVYDPTGISPTIAAGNLGGGKSPSKISEGISIRRLTPVECCRLQGFPDDWNEYGTNEKGEVVKMSDTQRYKQMGNAVTTNVIATIGSQILKAEEKDEA